MKVQTLLLASLAALGASTALPEDTSIYYPTICKKAQGIYDVCDTQHSYLRCHGHDVMLAVDCKQTSSTYCHVVNSRGYCDSTTPPDLSNSETGTYTTTSAAATVSAKST